MELNHKLFYRANCPACDSIQEVVDKRDFLEKISIDGMRAEDTEYILSQVPMLIGTVQNGKEVFRVVGADNIKKYLAYVE